MSNEKLETQKENNIAPQSIETRVSLLEFHIGSINQTLIRLESKIDKMESKFDSRFEKLETKFENKFDKLDSKIDSNYKWLIRMIVGIYASGSITLLGYFFKH